MALVWSLIPTETTSSLVLRHLRPNHAQVPPVALLALRVWFRRYCPTSGTDCRKLQPLRTVVRVYSLIPIETTSSRFLRHLRAKHAQVTQAALVALRV